MKRSICCLLLISLLLSACAHEHTWADATCTEPKTCTKCGETEGEPLGHEWVEATCDSPKTCSICGVTEGKRLGHQWVEPTCLEPKTCTVCGKTMGSPSKSHQVDQWETVKEATCSEEGERSGVCATCGETITAKITKTSHTEGREEIVKEATDLQQGEIAIICDVCGEVARVKKYSLTSEEKVQYYKNSCSNYSYNEVARHPDQYVGERVHFRGEVVQVLQDGDSFELRVNVTSSGGYYTYWSDTVYVVYTRENASEGKILEDDIIDFYGEFYGEISYESVLGATITIPCVIAKYIDLD